MCPQLIIVLASDACLTLTTFLSSGAKQKGKTTVLHLQMVGLTWGQATADTKKELSPACPFPRAPRTNRRS